MPLVHSENITDECLLMVWKLTESQEELYQKIPYWADTEELQAISHPQKKREWLAGRLVLSQLTEKAGLLFQGLWKDEHGKPFLAGCTHHISLTHTLEYVAAVIHPDFPLGIDMEKKHEKLIRTASKYLTDPEREQAGDSIEELCALWCAKEALFKLNGRKKVSFKQDIHIVPFAPRAVVTTGILHDSGTTRKASLHIRWFGEYCLVVAL